MTAAAEDDEKASWGASFAGERGGAVGAGKNVEEPELGLGFSWVL